MTLELEARRARWRRQRVREKMVLEADGDIALGGLGAHAENLEARLLFLPADPEGAVVPLGDATLEWLRSEQAAIENGPRLERKHSARAATDAIVAYDGYRDDGRFGDYRAIHAHGGLEAGATRVSYAPRETRIFFLRSLVSLTWTTAILQQQACEQWQVEGPFEVTLALRQTAGATLGGFAEGWRDHGSGLYDFSRCLDQHVLLRTELNLPMDPQALAFQMGDRLELAFGTVHRRYLASRGPFDSQFDPR